MKEVIVASRADQLVEMDLVARYRSALQFQADRLRARVRNLSVEPHWIAGTDSFWYRRDTEAGHEFVLVDPEQGEKQLAFDHERLAASISQATKADVDPAALPFDRFEYGDTPDTEIVRFEIDGTTWQANLAAGTLTKDEQHLPPVPKPFDAAISGVAAGNRVPAPDGRHEVFTRGHDLYLRDRTDGQERQLTHDGSADYAYGALSGTIWSGEVTLPRAGIEWPAQALWSPDSRSIATVRVDKRRVPELYLLDSVSDGDYTKRPVLHPYRYPLGGDPEIPQVELLVIDIETGAVIPIQARPLPGLYALIQDGSIRWTADGRLLYVRVERDWRRTSLHLVDPATGEDREVLVEAAATFIEPGQMPAPFGDGSGQVSLIQHETHVLWFSQRDGWGHLYRYDVATGALINQVTHGAWAVQEMVHIDDAGQWVYFLASGREAGRDPYYRHLYRCRYDGSDLTLLTPEDAEHEVVVSPAGAFFLDRYSRVDLPTVSILRRADGTHVMDLETADISQLEAVGWRTPERFQGIADDGETPIYGVLYRPPDFDPNRSYPIVEHVYGGPQVITAPITFSQGLAGFEGAAAATELGILTVSLDGRGTPGRSKAFQDGGEGFTDGAGLIDHIAVLRQLSERYPYIDLNRVGITGYSGGGYTSTRALLKYPDFYKVAVSGAGSHNQWIVGTSWGESFLGLPERVPEVWASQSNTALAGNLKGKLLLMHGELDDDTHPANSLQVADALIQAGKEFDFLIVPRQDHVGLSSTHYYRRKQWDYFVRHLLGVEPPDWNTVSFDEFVAEASALGPASKSTAS